MEGAPLEEDFDAFVNILRVSSCKSVTHHSNEPFLVVLFLDVSLKVINGWNMAGGASGLSHRGREKLRE